MKKLHKTGIAIISALAPAAALGITAGVVVASLPKSEEGIEAIWDDNSGWYITNEIEMVADQTYTIYANVGSEASFSGVNTFALYQSGSISNWSVTLDGKDDTDRWTYTTERSNMIFLKDGYSSISKGVVKVTFTAPINQTASCMFINI